VTSPAALLERARGYLHRSSQPRAAASPLQLADFLDGDKVVEAETAVGPLWVHRQDRVMTPHLSTGTPWEPELSAFLETELSPGATFVDVGANIGYFSVLGSRLVGNGGRVVAIEPEPGNVELLRANLWRHSCWNSTVLPVAAYSHAGHLSLVLNEENRGGTGVLEVTDGRLVPCAPLDDLLAGWKFNVVKIDAEGTERLVLEGMRELLDGNPAATLVVELLAKVEDLRGQTPAEVLAYYRSLGFDLFLITPSGGLQPASAEEVLEAGSAVDFLNVVLRRP
jgi:FkbM family methyltransferase